MLELIYRNVFWKNKMNFEPACVISFFLFFTFPATKILAYMTNKKYLLPKTPFHHLTKLSKVSLFRVHFSFLKYTKKLRKESTVKSVWGVSQWFCSKAFLLLLWSIPKANTFISLLYFFSNIIIRTNLWIHTYSCVRKSELKYQVASSRL